MNGGLNFFYLNTAFFFIAEEAMKTNNEQKTQPKKMFFPPNRFRSCVPYNWCVQCSTSYSAFLYIFFSICFGLLRAHFRFIYKRWLLVRHNYLRVLFCSLACSLSLVRYVNVNFLYLSNLLVYAVQLLKI